MASTHPAQRLRAPTHVHKNHRSSTAAARASHSLATSVSCSTSGTTPVTRGNGAPLMATLRANNTATLVKARNRGAAANSTFWRRNTKDCNRRSSYELDSHARRAATAPTVRAMARTSKPVMASCQAGIDIPSMAAHREAEVAFGAVAVLGGHVPVDVIRAGWQRRESNLQQASIVRVDLRLAAADHLPRSVLDHHFVEQGFEIAVEPDLHRVRCAVDGRADGGVGVLGESVREHRARRCEGRDREHAQDR